MNPHLTNDELLDRLYGLVLEEGEASLHLRECSRCTERFQAFERQWTTAISQQEVSSEFLASQRRRIYARLEARPGTHMRWVPAVAAGFLVAAGVFLYHPADYSSRQPSRPTPPAHVEMSDEQLFSDVYSMEQSGEPRAAAPIHALFEVSGKEAEQ